MAVAASKAADPFAVGLSHEDSGANGDDAWGGDFELDDGGEADTFADADGGDEFDDGLGTGAVAAAAKGSEYYVPPTAGPGVAVRWTKGSKLAGELAAAGAFKEAMALLKEEIGAGSFESMKPSFMSAFSGCRAVLDGAASMSLMTMYISKLGGAGDVGCVSVSLGLLRDRFRGGQQRFQQAKFDEAMKIFSAVMSAIPLLVVSSGREAEDAKTALNMSREYLIGLKLEAAGREARAAGDSARQITTAGLFTKCGMTPVHVQLALRAAMKSAFDSQNFVHAAGFARRLLELSPAAGLAQKARQVMQVCDRNMSNRDEIDFDESKGEIVVECGDLRAMYEGEERLKCSYCGAVYAAGQYANTVCKICAIGVVGKRSSGLRVYR